MLTIVSNVNIYFGHFKHYMKYFLDVATICAAFTCPQKNISCIMLIKHIPATERCSDMPLEYIKRVPDEIVSIRRILR